MNIVILKGRLTKDPEIKFTPSGMAVLNFTLATPSGYNIKEQKGITEFIDCVAWGKTAEGMNQYLLKGGEITVEGKMQKRSYEAKDGTKRYVTEVVVNRFEFCGGRKEDVKASDDVADFSDFGTEIAIEGSLPF